MFNTYTSVTSGVSFSLLRSRIEAFGLARVKLAVERSRSSVSSFLDLLSHPSHRSSLLRGQPPLLSAMLAPKLSESALRWEELGSGFSGHGFDDRQREHYTPPDTDTGAAEQPQREKGWLVQYVREQRRKLGEATSERLRAIRSRWFGWRLRMKQIEHEHEHKPSRQQQQQPGDAESQNSAEEHSHQQTTEQQQRTTAQPREKRKSWVWEWSRNSKP